MYTCTHRNLGSISTLSWRTRGGATPGEFFCSLLYIHPHPSYKNHLLQEPASKLRPEVVLVTRTSDVTFFAVTIRNFSRKYRGKIANFSFPIEIRIVFQGGGEAETSLSKPTSHSLFFEIFFWIKSGHNLFCNPHSS